MEATFALALASLICSVVAVLLSLRAAWYAARYSAASVSVQQLARIETELTDTRDLIESLRKSLHKMRSRRRMQELREDDDAPPADREGLKRQLRAKVGLTGVPSRDRR